MARPEVNEFAEVLYEALEPAMTYEDEDRDWPLLRFLHCITDPFVKAWEIAHGGARPWATLLDPALCPEWALSWLAQWGGVVIEPAWSEDDIREAIATPSGLARGRPAAILRAPLPYLTGTKTVIMYERQPMSSAYRLYIRTWDSETPDPDEVEAAILRQKPGGIVLDYASLSGQDYQLLESTHATYADVASDYDSYAEATADV